MLEPSFVVPAEYFYALHAHLPIQVSPETRYRMATLEAPERNLEQFSRAIEDGIIVEPAINRHQAVRRLEALGRKGGSPVALIDPSTAAFGLVEAWLNFPGSNIGVFWNIDVVGSHLAGHLYLLLSEIIEEDPAELIAALAINSVGELQDFDASQWEGFFEANPSLLPDFTRPGSGEERIRAFVRRLRQYFVVFSGDSGFDIDEGHLPPSFGVPENNPLKSLSDAYAVAAGAPFPLATLLDEGALQAAVEQVFPGDLRSQTWLARSAVALNHLSVVTQGLAAEELRFSLMEALFARGFTTRESIHTTLRPDFRDALAGTVAYPFADAIHEQAGGTEGSGEGEAVERRPVNPDGSLVHCVPPEHLSPLGPVAYLHELLRVSTDATCAESDGEGATLAQLLSERRGPLGELLATRSNLETPLLVIDLVNESLEKMVATNEAWGAVNQTASAELAGHPLEDPDGTESRLAHDPATLFAALPEHSSPAVPVATPNAYVELADEFAAPLLPYSQPLDVARSYLGVLGSSRFEVMRRFREEITEFVLRPASEPAAFRSHLWRYPVRLELALEYLGIDPGEAALFQESVVGDALAQLFGFPNASSEGWPADVLRLSTFLERTGIRYCDLRELVESRWLDIALAGGDEARDQLPDCEPCCLQRFTLVFEGSTSMAQFEGLRRLMGIIRLWRKLVARSGCGYSFRALADIVDVLGWFPTNGNTDSDFVRQLAALQILREEFCLELVDRCAPEPEPGASGAERTHLLALWVPDATHRPWAIEHFIEKMGKYAEHRFRCPRRPAKFLKLLEDNLELLSRLAGFDPEGDEARWDARPTNTLRFAEVLAKIYASSFGIGELSFLFTSDEHLAGDDPLPLASRNETRESPLDLPDDDETFSLWALRRKLLDVEVSDDEVACWSWKRIVRSLEEDFGYPTGADPDPLEQFGARFFPSIVGEVYAGDEVQLQYRAALPLSAPTSELMWNTPADGPFRYEAASEELVVELPLTDAALLEKLGRIRQLNATEQEAVQHLYFAPRVDLARFAFLFPSFIEADERLIQEADEAKRWMYFQRAFARVHARAKILAEHLAAHVAAVTKTETEGASDVAWKLLKHLLADENRGLTSWESDGGERPDVTWEPRPSGGAFAALLGLVGTGLRGELRSMGEDGELVFRELRGPMDAFGSVRNGHNAPLPTLIPALDYEANLRFVTVRNGFALQNENARVLGGAEGFRVTWRGVLLVEESGGYVFRAGLPTPEGEEPGKECVPGQRFSVTLRRGQKKWRVISHEGPGKSSNLSADQPLGLKRGAYDLVIEFEQCPPDFDTKKPLPTQTGFQLKYSGPDTAEELVTVPAERLYVALKDETLADSVAEAKSDKVHELLELLYRSTLRDVRRTYQRAFKALLFARRLGLSAGPIADSGQSEIEYLLSHPEEFEGLSFYLQGGNYVPHRAFFDLNFLPVGDLYFPPPATQDQRAEPSPQRSQALFDWWERLFDYTVLRESTKDAPEAPAWLSFHEAGELHHDGPAHLLRHIGIDLSRAELVLSFYDGFQVQSEHLKDERWTIRVWRADQWLTEMLARFFAKDVREARPDLWASDDPSLEHAGLSGNANLVRFVRAGLLERGAPVRYEDLKRLNDGLRVRARAALIAYLTTPARDRVALPWGGFARTEKDLSDLLLMDVEAGLCQRASRVEEGVTAVQNFVQRARLGLEAFEPSVDFTLLWDRRFRDYRTWQACTRHRLYKENFIEWQELEAARRSESFRFFEDRLRQATLTIAAPAGLVNFGGERPPPSPGIALLQAKEPAVLKSLPAAEPGTGQGLSLLGTPERHGRPSWLAPLSGSAASTKLPYFIEAAIRLGVEFVRVAAAGMPMGSATFDRPLSTDTHGCCTECGVSHPPNVDEYYFWLLDTRHFVAPEQDADARDEEVTQSDENPWRDESKAPKLLAWESDPMVHLVWARVHNGVLLQVRRSSEGVRIAASVSTLPKLTFMGRFADSLLFEVQGGEAPPGHEADPNPGFRYDLPSDSAEVVPPVTAIDDEEEPEAFLLDLPSYPYFLFFTPGAPLIAPSFFSQALTAAGALRAHCQFEAALKWYERYFAPLTGDARWCPDPEEACCHGAEPEEGTARRRAVVLHYLETLLEWGDAVMRRHSPEAFQQARLIFDTATRVLGARPRTVVDGAPGGAPSPVAQFLAAPAALNPRLLSLYERVDDRLAKIHSCLTAPRLTGPLQKADYFGDLVVRNGWKSTSQPCIEEEGWCLPVCPYRFVFMIQRSMEVAREVQTLGGLLLSAYEKGDAEYLASLRQSHEKQLLELSLSIRQNQWRDADWQVQALEKTKEIAQTRRRYFRALIDFGLIGREVAYQELTLAGMDARTAGNVMMAIGQFMHLIPDVYVGQNNFTHLPVGSKLASMFSAIATISNTVGDILTTHANLNLTEAGWERREDEWIHQVEVLDLEIEQIERQILGAERRRDIALRELNNHQRQIEQSGEVLDFLRDKFTAHELYLWLQKETAALHRQMYELALQTARQAQRAFNFELGHLTEDFIGGDHWDDLHEGLLAGERLMGGLRRMEKAYTDENRREYELVKQVSLRELFPLALLELRLTGKCEIELPEWLFDLDYPGHYLRRIKNVSLTIPSVLGPMTGVHCRLTLLSSETRIDPRLSGPVGACCDKPRVDPRTKTCGSCGRAHDENGRPLPGMAALLSKEAPVENGYRALKDDPRIVKLYGAKEAIATSTAQDDAGLFELNFRDERYLPFEFHGAVSRWRLELPPENNYFDLSTITDAILQLRYTAREGGEVLRRAAMEAVQKRLPDAGVRMIDVRQELPTEWHRLLSPRPDAKRRTLELEVQRDWFPFLPGKPAVCVRRLEFFFEVGEEEDCGALKGCGTVCDAHDCCPGAQEPLPDKLTLKVTVPEWHGGKCIQRPRVVHAVANAKWPGVYHGVLDVNLGPMTHSCDGPTLTVEFSKSVQKVVSVFVALGYETESQVSAHTKGFTHART